MRRRGWASTCFAFMLPKNKVGQVDLFARTEGTPRSPVCLQQGSLVYFSGYALHNPNPKYLCTSALPFANQSVRRQGTANCTITSALLPLLRSCGACVDLSTSQFGITTAPWQKKDATKLPSSPRLSGFTSQNQPRGMFKTLVGRSLPFSVLQYPDP